MIGIFDSGVGGLTLAKEIDKRISGEDILYYADLAHSPYGNKSKKSIIKFSEQIADFLLKKGADTIIIACNTASALAYEHLKRKFKVPIYNVIESIVSEADSISKKRKIGVIGTSATILSKAYEKEFVKIGSSAKIISRACPLFVPLIEEDYINKPETRKIAEHYLGDLKKSGIDTLILGCTHYPILKNLIQKIMGLEVTLVDSSVLSEIIGKEIQQKRKLTHKKEKGAHYYFSSDIPNNFEKIAKRFMGKKVKAPKLSVIDD